MMRISENIKLVNFQYIVLFPTSVLLLWPQRGRKGESYFRERVEYDLGESPSDRSGSRKKLSSQRTKKGVWCKGAWAHQARSQLPEA